MKNCPKGYTMGSNGVCVKSYAIGGRLKRPPIRAAAKQKLKKNQLMDPGGLQSFEPLVGAKIALISAQMDFMMTSYD